ncbi:Protein FAR1-RELATED SEQUENCE 9 [Bienertia sinuspersici]
MWCPAYNKEKFSGGILSSQRSESTNNSLRKKLHPTHGLCELYKNFIHVIEDWRRRENAEDHTSTIGNRHLCFQKVKLLEHAQSVYTINIYLDFEQRFVKGVACDCNIVSFNYPIMHFLVGHPEDDFIKHTVCFNKDELTIECTCKQFTETGILCAHALRVYHSNNVHSIPTKYIVGRWSKNAMCTRIDGDHETREAVIESSVWRIQTIRNFISLVNSSQHDIATRNVVDSTYKELKVKVSSLIGQVDESITLEDVENMLYPNIKDPPKKRKKGTKDKRPKSTLEKQCNKLKGHIKAWKNRAEKASIKTRATAQESAK